MICENFESLRGFFGLLKLRDFPLDVFRHRVYLFLDIFFDMLVSSASFKLHLHLCYLDILKSLLNLAQDEVAEPLGVLYTLVGCYLVVHVSFSL